MRPRQSIRPRVSSHRRTSRRQKHNIRAETAWTTMEPKGQRSQHCPFLSGRHEPEGAEATRAEKPPDTATTKVDGQTTSAGKAFSFRRQRSFSLASSRLQRTHDLSPRPQRTHDLSSRPERSGVERSGCGGGAPCDIGPTPGPSVLAKVNRTHRALFLRFFA